MNFKKTYHLHPAMQILYKAIIKERIIKLVFSIWLVVGGLIVPYLYFQKNSFIAIAGLVSLVVGTKLLFSVIRTPQAVDEQLWHLLNEQPRQIVWVYSVTTQTMPFGFYLWNSGAMYFMLLDGNEISINLPVNKMKMVSKFLNRLLPHATFGFSEERQLLFDKDPKNLLK